MSAIKIRRFHPGEIFQWVLCGIRLLSLRPLEALLPAAVFALVALLILKIPLLGNLLFLLILPTPLASYFQLAHRTALAGDTPRAAEKGAPPYLYWGRALQQGLFGVWSKTDNIFPLVLIGGVMVLLGLGAMFLFNTVGGQAVVSQHKFFDLTTLFMIQLLLAYAIAAAFWAFVAGAAMWMLQMLVVRDTELDAALRRGWRGFTRNIGATMTFTLLLAALGLLPGAVAQLWLPFWYNVVLWLLLTLFAALFGFSGYCSFRLVFVDVEEKPQRPVSPYPPRPGTGPKPPTVGPGPRGS